MTGGCSECDDPLCLTHNNWQRPMLTFRDGVPAGIAEYVNASPLSPMGFPRSFPPAVGIVVVVDNSVCGQAAWEGALCLPQLRHSVLKTMGVLGVSTQCNDCLKKEYNLSISAPRGSVH